MEITKNTVTGKLGQTVIYSMPNVRYENSSLCWDSFRFYTPLSSTVDNNNNGYFDVPAGEVEISRDEVFDKTVFIAVEIGKEPTAYSVLEGESWSKSIGLEGDFVATIIVPHDTAQPIQCWYIEVSSEG